MSLRRLIRITLCVSLIVLSLAFAFSLYNTIRRFGVAAEEAMEATGMLVLSNSEALLSRVEGIVSFLNEDEELPSHMLPEVRLLLSTNGRLVDRVYRGYLPAVLHLPQSLFADEWQATDLVSFDGRVLLVRSLQTPLDEFIVGVDPAELLGDLQRFDLPFRFHLAVVDQRGRVLWVHRAKATEALALRGAVPVGILEGGSWRQFRPAGGERLLLKAKTVGNGLVLISVVPFSRLFLWLARLAFPFVVAASSLALLLFFLGRFLRRSLFFPLFEVAALAKAFGQALRNSDPLDIAGKTEELSVRISERHSGAVVEELQNFIEGLAEALEVMTAQQEELAAYSEEVKAVNTSLTEANELLRRREEAWRRALEATHLATGGVDIKENLRSIAGVVRSACDAFGVIISRIEGEEVRVFTWSGFGADGLTIDKIPAKESSVAQALEEARPIWIEDAAAAGRYTSAHPAVRSELNLPLMHGGKGVGGLTVCFEECRTADSELVEMISPIALAVSGLLASFEAQEELRESYYYTASRLQVATAYYHDETAEHLERMGAYSTFLTKALGRSSEEVETIGHFSKLHDIGKIKIPLDILSKPGPLSDDEFEIIKLHTIWGAEIIGPSQWLAPARTICLHHHERYDGGGYPYGLSGEEIPWEAQVVAIADVYDALRSKRAYKPPFDHERACRIILDGDERLRSGAFGPKMLDIFRALHKEMAEIYDLHAEDDAL
jgi:HD-GYP domain-containing protein (c-di-GMP phosphodiesterase class II)